MIKQGEGREIYKRMCKLIAEGRSAEVKEAHKKLLVYMEQNNIQKTANFVKKSDEKLQPKELEKLFADV